MPRYSVVFLAIAIVAGGLGFSGLVGAASIIALLICLLFTALVVIPLMIQVFKRA